MCAHAIVSHLRARQWCLGLSDCAEGEKAAAEIHIYTRSLAGGCQNEMNRKLKREGLVVDGWDETNEQKRDRAAEKELHET